MVIQDFYRFLHQIGYNHPIHPTLVNFPIGLVIGAFILALAALFFKSPNTASAAKATWGLALFFTIITPLAGYLDWVHFYQGVYLYPFAIKQGLACALFILLAAGAWIGYRSPKFTIGLLLIYLLASVNVIFLGYFGGDVVYHNRAPGSPAAPQGQALYLGNCSGCHPFGANQIRPHATIIYSDKLTDFKTFDGWVRDPKAPMPPFSDEELTGRQMMDLYNYITHVWRETGKPEAAK